MVSFIDFSTEFFKKKIIFCLQRIGDHVSGASTIKSTGDSISNEIENDSSSIGGMKTLPFLFKVLSVAKPLSIQVHPNKVHSMKLLKRLKKQN